jgi:NAD+ diphosphatase
MQFQGTAALDSTTWSPGLWFIFHGDKMLVKTEGDSVSVPFSRGPIEYHLRPYWNVCVGLLGNTPCYSALVDGDVDVPHGAEFHGLRGLFGQLEDEMFGLSGRAMQLVKWDYTHQFCSRCGKPAGTRNEEGAQICRHCGYLSYPRISPAVIVAVFRENRILLGHNNRFPQKRYSVIAGYVEMGETLEECVKREIWEEVRIKVQNIRYFGSQPWPFSSSLMIAFTAEYAGGDISVDNTEIADAKWFAPDALPDIPDKLSIARQLIDWFVETQRRRKR